MLPLSGRRGLLPFLKGAKTTWFYVLSWFSYMNLMQNLRNRKTGVWKCALIEWADAQQVFTNKSAERKKALRQLVENTCVPPAMAPCVAYTCMQKAESKLTPHQHVLCLTTSVDVFVLPLLHKSSMETAINTNCVSWNQPSPITG